MSGAEAGLVIGLISGVISIIDATKKVYDAAKDAKGQPEAFRQIAARLPLVIEILRRAEERASALDETALEALEHILESCKAKAEDLRKIFQKVIRKDDDKWYDRYKKAVGTLKKGNTVECLMEGILEDIQVLACERLIGTATDAQVKEIEESIKEMHEMPSSLPDEAGGVIQTHSGSGDNIGHTGPGTMNIHKGEGDLYHNVISGGANFGSNPTFNISNHQSSQDHSDLQNRSCLQDLRTTDPREDKKRIEDTKGGLLRDSYQWVFEHPDFHKWRNAEQGQLLWIKGDPGKGKTMLLCGIIDEMSSLTRLGEDKNPTTLLSYFFCQATDSRINNAVAVVRNLIYLLIDQQPLLIKHVRKKYDQAGKALFEDVNAWVALSKIFTSILQDPALNNTSLIIDALDECVTDLPKLLNFINQNSSISPRIKWVVSSRNWPDIEERLERAGHKMKLCLELNPESISAAVTAYIKHKTRLLEEHKKYDDKTREAVVQFLISNAHDTFLWVALVCENLEKVTRRKTITKLIEFPPGLDALYQRMISQICNSDDADLCKHILAIISTVYRPITLMELTALVETLGDVSDDYESLVEIIKLCGSLLTLRGHTIYFVHQSAKDYLLEKVYDEVFPPGIRDIHYTIFSRSLQVMSRTLRRNVYSLRAPGISIDEVKQPDPDPLAIARYSCLYWVDHLLDFDTRGNSSNDFKADSSVYSFLCHGYLYWLEALSLMKGLSRSILMITKLENWVQANENPDLFAFVHDAKRFALYNRSMIEQAPLQSYCSALVFAPEKSIVRLTFDKCIPSWIQRKPKTQAHWSAALQMLEGHCDFVNAVAFSLNGKLLASASYDKTVKLWDADTGAELQTLEGHTEGANAVAFSPDSKVLASASTDKKVKLWDADTGAVLQTLEGHTEGANAVAFSPDGKVLASASYDKTVKLWDADTGAELQTLKGHTEGANAVAFSPNSKLLASGSDDKTIRLWDAATTAVMLLEGHSSIVSAVAFLPDGKRLVSASWDRTFRLWDATTGAFLRTLNCHTEPINAIAISPDGMRLASVSWDNMVRLWDANTGTTLQTLEGHTEAVNAVAFSPDGKLLASAAGDNTVGLWDAAARPSLQTLESHSGSVTAIAFSPDGTQLVSASYDKTIRMWDKATGAAVRTLQGHSDDVNTLTFSPNGKLLASASNDKTVKLWDAGTGISLQTIEGFLSSVNAVAFSPDGNQLVSVSNDKVIIQLDIATAAVKTLECHCSFVNAVAFSPDSKVLASASTDKKVNLWDADTGAVLQTLEGHTEGANAVVFSPDGKVLASASYDKTVKLWDADTGAVLQTLKGHSHFIRAVAFSLDGKVLASASNDKTVKLWDTGTGAMLKTLKVNANVKILSFSDDGIFLQTDRGLLHTASHSNGAGVSQLNPSRAIFIKEQWVSWGMENMLWLPPSHRPRCVAVYGSVVALGHASGRVSILEFAFEFP